MKILVIGDLHGRKPNIHFREFDAIIFVGDVASDKELGVWYKKWFRALKKNSNIGDGNLFIISKIGKRNFNNMRKRSLEEGRKIIKYLNNFDKPIFTVAGNWDQSYGKTRIKNVNKDNYNYYKSFLDYWIGDQINSKLIKGFKNMKNCMYKNHEFMRMNFIGYGLSSGPEKPGIKKKLKKLDAKKINKLNNAYNKIGDKLNNAYKERNKKYPTIFITHNIPYNTKLDVIRDEKSYAHKKHLGSTVARQICVRYHPFICVGGHVHDHSGKDKIGKTIVINPGFGKSAQVLIDIDEIKGKIRKIKFANKNKKN